MYQLLIKYGKSRPDDVWGPYVTYEDAQDVVTHAEQFPEILDIILERTDED